MFWSKKGTATNTIIRYCILQSVSHSALLSPHSFKIGVILVFQVKKGRSERKGLVQGLMAG